MLPFKHPHFSFFIPLLINIFILSLSLSLSLCNVNECERAVLAGVMGERVAEVEVVVESALVGSTPFFTPCRSAAL